MIRRQQNPGVVETLEARGRPVPEELMMPDLPPGADEWLEAFWELGSDRQIGMGVGPIPSASIDRWIERHGYSDEGEAFRTCIRAMDAEARNPTSDKPRTAADFFGGQARADQPPGQ